MYIENKLLTPSDIDRQVVYSPTDGSTPEVGNITSFNHQYVFVRFGYGSTAQACDPEKLKFVIQEK